MAGRILVLDDEENYAEMLQELLLENHYRVDMATRPERALEQLEEIPYDLVISDYKMPVMDGADLLKKARQLYPNLPFILVSGLMNTPELVKVANMSVTLVMEKPLDTSAFLEHVARFSTPAREGDAGASTEEGDAAGVAASPGFPATPRFFCAESSEGARFLEELWRLSGETRHLFLFQSPGGDGKQALRDLSEWRGNQDHPLVEMDFATLAAEDGESRLRQALASPEASRVACVAVSDATEIRQAKTLAEGDLAGKSGQDDLLVVFLFEGPAEGRDALMETVGEMGLRVPPLGLRPADSVEYAHRLVKIQTEQSGGGKPPAFSDEAVYGLLAYGWPGNYKEMREVLSRAAKHAVAGGEIDRAILEQALGEALPEVPAPGERLGALLQRFQGRYLGETAAAGKLSAGGLARRFELDPAYGEDYAPGEVPLVNPDLGRIG